jgi:Type I restriction enzyme R protein N terminus (HSDR_N)
MAEHFSHHLIYGKLTDYLTNEELTDTDDERLRQSIYRMMVEQKGYKRDELIPRTFIDTFFTHHFVRSTVDLTVKIRNVSFMIIRYGPGSLVSRERAAIAAARVIHPDFSIPLAVVTNSYDAELLDTMTGKIIGNGLDSIPDRADSLILLPTLAFHHKPKGNKLEREKRILNAFDLERCCL